LDAAPLIQVTRLSDIEVQLGGNLFHGQVLQIRARGKGQDVVRVGTGFIGVADGATPLHGEPGSQVRRFASSALGALDAAGAVSARRAFKAAINATRQASHTTGRASCTVALARTVTAGIEVDVLGDCLAIVGTRNEPVILRDDRLPRVDDVTIRRMQRSMAAGMSPQEARELVGPDLMRNRATMNQAGTYWSYADDSNAGRHVLVRTLPADSVRTILLCTDGFHRLWSPFGVATDPADLLALALAEGLDTLGRRLRTIERRPTSVARYARFSRYDDATAVLLTRS
jgi:uncharacterized protein YoaH (UPF0181 family)